ncbi:MAG: hypothetical protein LBD53_04985 [Tannerella sp.]|nr:hypothetical protein [Tannerella sp.]
MKKIMLLVAIFAMSECSSNLEGQWKDPLSSSEAVRLKNAVAEIDGGQKSVYLEKIKKISVESLPYSNGERVRNLESYKEVYEWIRNDVGNFPLLFLYMIYEEKILGEEYSNTCLLLWDLSDELYPSVTERMRTNEDFDPVNLIKALLSVTVL